MKRLVYIIIMFSVVFPCCLSGSIPKELGQLGALKYLELQNNKLEGEREESEVLGG